MKRLFIILFPLVVCYSGDLTAQSTPSISATSEVISPAPAISYVVNGGPTKVNLMSTTVIPTAEGEAKVEVRDGITLINAKVENLAQPGEMAAEFLTYVLWAVTPDGRTNNLGAIMINEKGDGVIKVTSQLQTFSLIVSAEPYHCVRQPSEIVVLKNQPRRDTKGAIVGVDKYRLMKRSQYEQHGGALRLSPDLLKEVPLEMYEARNAIAIAKSRGAEKLAPELFTKAQRSMKQAEDLLKMKADRKEIVSAARQTVQFSEDSRALAADRQEQERIILDQQITALNPPSDSWMRRGAGGSTQDIGVTPVSSMLRVTSLVPRHIQLHSD